VLLAVLVSACGLIVGLKDRALYEGGDASDAAADATMDVAQEAVNEGGLDVADADADADAGQCDAESDPDFCKSHDASCGMLSAPDNCGMQRSVASCGMCGGCGMGCNGNTCGVKCSKGVHDMSCACDTECCAPFTLCALNVGCCIPNGVANNKANCLSCCSGCTFGGNCAAGNLCTPNCT